MTARSHILGLVPALLLGVSSCGGESDASDTNDTEPTGTSAADSTSETSAASEATEASTSTGNESTSSSGSSTGGGSTTTEASTDGSSSAGDDSEASSRGSTGGSDSTGDPEFEPYAVGGAFVGLPDYADTEARGFGILIRRAGGTEVSVGVAGLMPDTAYPAHVHNQACDDESAGPHYKLDPEIEDTVEDNEIWPAFTTNANGVGHGFIEVPGHVAREDAVSIVVHDPMADNAKMLCLDLVPSSPMDPFVTSGTATVLEGGMDLGFEDMTASVEMERSVETGMTTVTLEVTGLDAEETYAVHVHDQDCSLGSGGGHYKIDYEVAEALEENEIWLPITTQADGSGTSEVTVDHLARAEAMALVIHNPDDTGTRIACVDLWPGGEAPNRLALDVGSLRLRASASGGDAAPPPPCHMAAAKKP